MVRASDRARTGAITNIVINDVRNHKGSLVKSFMASAIGCKRP